MTEDELNLWRCCREGDEAARKELVLRNLGPVKFLADQIHMSVNWVDRDVLMNEGVIGLLKAMDRFDYNCGVKFATYARNDIRGAILASPEVSHNLPRRPYENLRKIRQAQVELAMRLERKPTLDEIAEAVGLTVSQVNEALDAWHIAFADGIVDPDSDPEAGERSKTHSALIEGKAGADDPWQNVNDAMVIEKAFLRLSERESLILTLYYWEDQTDSEIARRLGLTLSNARKIRLRALEKLRGMLEVKEDVAR